MWAHFLWQRSAVLTVTAHEGTRLHAAFTGGGNFCRLIRVVCNRNLHLFFRDVYWHFDYLWPYLCAINPHLSKNIKVSDLISKISKKVICSINTQTGRGQRSERTFCRLVGFSWVLSMILMATCRRRRHSLCWRFFNIVTHLQYYHWIISSADRPPVITWEMFLCLSPCSVLFLRFLWVLTKKKRDFLVTK